MVIVAILLPQYPGVDRPLKFLKYISDSLMYNDIKNIEI